MARRGGLGPQGHRAVERAAQELHRAPIIAESPKKTPAPTFSQPRYSRNPAALSAPQPGEAVEQPSDWYLFDSSRVVEAAYDPSSSRLYVRFVKPAPIGTPWTYEGVPPNVWRNFKRSQSPGKFVNRVLNDYNYHRGRWD